MQVANLKAVTNASGGQIDLSWTNPVSGGFKGITILRREFAFPEGDSDPKASRVYENLSPVSGVDERFSDTGLSGGTVYYYSVIAYESALDYSPAFVSAAASDSYHSADYLYKLLPALYRNYDETGTGQLKRFLGILGPQVDLFRSFTWGMRDFSDTDRIDGALLDLLAKWIGWSTDLNLGLAKQRNEIKYASHYYRTMGIAANVRATINRLATWDARVKEFVHNVFLSNNPERLTIREWERQGDAWKTGGFVNLEVMHDGKPSAIKGEDGRTWLFYHAVSGKECDISGSRVDVWCKTFDFGEWLPAKRISLDGDINKHPAALQLKDGSMLLLWSCYGENAGKKSPKIKSCLLSRGRESYPARLLSALSGPFALDDGEFFSISVNGEAERIVTFREEHFNDIKNASAEEIAGLLDREIPGVVVDLSKDRKIRITSNLIGSGSALTVNASAGAAKLGLPVGTFTGSCSTTAKLTGTLKEPFSIKGKSLVIRTDRERDTEIIFKNEQTTAQVVETINRVIDVAHEEKGYVRLSSPSEGGDSFISMDLDASTAAADLGFGAPLPQMPSEEENSEPTAFADENGKVWLFWSSRRTGTWKIWYSCFDGKNWGAAKQLTTGGRPDRRPEAVLNSGRIWVFWSRKKENKLWNVYFRTTTSLDFAGLTEADWVEKEIEPLPADYSNDDPFAIPLESGIELFYSSNRADGWNIWSKKLDEGSQDADSQITTGQFTHRAPVALKTAGQELHLFSCTNESRSYKSELYPLSETTDFRYTGSTVVDTRNTAKISFRKDFEDIQHYACDTLKEDPNWYARDVLGVFLQPDTMNEQFIVLNKSRLLKVLKQFLPVQVRPVIILKPPVCSEKVYTYAFPGSDPQRLIGELEKDILTSITGEAYSGPAAESEDTLPGWVWLHTWSGQYPDQITVDFTKSPVDTKYRTWHTGLKRGG